jgi:hypothetical protein
LNATFQQIERRECLLVMLMLMLTLKPRRIRLMHANAFIPSPISKIQSYPIVEYPIMSYPITITIPNQPATPGYPNSSNNEQL